MVSSRPLGLVLLAVLAPVASFAQAMRTGTYFVNVPVLEERSSPGGPVVNRIYRGQRVTVTEVRSGWARVTDPSFDPRWVRAVALSSQRPPDLPQKAVPAAYRDPRIASDAIPKVGQDGLTQHDVGVLWRGAAHMLKTGRCSKVEYADKSTSRPGTYYVSCGGPQNVFFTEADLK